MSRVAADLAFRPAGVGTVINVTLSPHHGLAGMTHSSAARAAGAGLTRALARVWKAAARTVPLQGRGREEEHACLSALGWSRLGRALSGSVVTLDGARDNWF